ncbi:MAG: hypothetical protein A2583_11900 [Bdellovibrionales bacterium RIFOXYD1_FULL_53_11]|nr:MAG: hypothetical protein A2583_11900 [Bdellovibrionales bacterium RIFOXYD1_FULL_53_11]
MNKTISGLFIMFSVLFSMELHAATLEDFGYGSMGIRKPTPLLAIMIDFNGKDAFVHDKAYYENRVFSWAGPSINGYFIYNSYGQFHWKQAGLLGPYKLDFKNSDVVNFGNAKQAAIDEGFDFSAYDKNNDGQVTTDELAILIIDNATNEWGAKRGTDPACPKAGTVTVCSEVAAAGQRASLVTMAHELSHLMGAVDLYGALNDQNYNVSLMTATVVIGQYDFNPSFHLDPWHKMAFGWLRPEILTNSQSKSRDLYAPFDEKRNAIIIHDPAKGTKEFFILEHRTRHQPNQWPTYDDNVVGDGIAVWNVQLDQNKFPVWHENPSTPGVGDFAVWFMGGPDWQRGKGTIWSKSNATPVLKWYDGSDAGMFMDVRNANSTAEKIHTRLQSVVWQEVSGCARQVATGAFGNTWVLGCNSNGDGYEIFRRKQNAWEKMPSGAKAIAVEADGTAWIVKNSGKIFKYEGTAWVEKPGCAETIAAGSKEQVWATACASTPGGKKILKWNGSNWDVVTGGLKRIAVTPKTGVAWGVNDTGKIYRRDGNYWTQLGSGCASDIAVSLHGQPWILGCTVGIHGFEVFRMSGLDNKWHRIPGYAVDIALDPFGKPWKTTKYGNKIYTAN